MITIFTPTYNRRRLIERLYNSLTVQTSKNFEWLVVDDGSTDDTAIFFQNLPKAEFSIRYYRQENSGKHIAINNGADLANGDWFFVVDSDDYLLPDAIEIQSELVKSIAGDDRFACVCTNRIYEDGTPNGNEVRYDVLDTNFIDYSLKYKYTGEKPSCMRTSVWREFKFPTFPGEKFCSEALVLRRIGTKYLNRYFNKCTYVMEGYLEDGLTHSLKKHFEASPTYSCLIFKEQIELSGMPFKSVLATYYNYWHYYRKCQKEYPEVKPTIQLRLIGYPLYLMCSLAKRILK